MAKRKSFLIFFSYDENWLGGTYYLINLIKALNLLPARERPLIYVCYSTKNDKEILKQIRYKYLIFKDPDVHYSLLERAINKWGQKIFSKKLIDKAVNKLPVDVCFIDYYQLARILKIKFPVSKICCWIPDLQDRFLPDFFTGEELARRSEYYNLAIKNKVTILFSSRSSESDFNKSFGSTENIKHVVPFAVFHDSFENLDIDKLKKKYGITGKYFMISNQFWKHKNHRVVIEAAGKVKKELINNSVQFILTGKEYDYRNPEYLNELKELIRNYGLENNFLFLGLIPRDEQLKLMSCSIAVIQPSLFEGWSTIVEDAKAINQLLIVSNIDVHKEQSNDNCLFFDPHNPEQLAAVIEQQIIQRQPVHDYDYSSDRIAFARNFNQII